MRRFFPVIIAFMFLVLFTCLDASAIGWPVWPDSSNHLIGNNYGQYQQFDDGTPYMHTGIDIMVPPGTPVYAVESGYVKSIMTPSADTHWRVVIGQLPGTAECEGIMYAHLEEPSITVYPGQYVEAGTQIGTIVEFTGHPGFNHLHLSRVRYWGTTDDWNNGFSNWEYIGNIINELEFLNDPDMPAFEPAIGSQLLAFCENGTTNYFAEGAPVSGKVDIICRVYDYCNDYAHKLAPYLIQCKIDDEPWQTAIDFRSPLLSYPHIYDITPVIYQDDATCNSEGGYEVRNYYYNITNHDDDSLIELTDTAGCWDTREYINGQHQIFVCAVDAAGLAYVWENHVEVANYFSVQGTINLIDDCPVSPAGTIVFIDPEGLVDTTDEDGHFYFPAVGGGEQSMGFTRPGYLGLTWGQMIDQDLTLNMETYPDIYEPGDANADGAANVGDVVYNVNFVFKGGAGPQPCAAGDANGDGALNVADAVYLINFIFKDGPPPVE